MGAADTHTIEDIPYSSELSSPKSQPCWGWDPHLEDHGGFCISTAIQSAEITVHNSAEITDPIITYSHGQSLESAVSRDGRGDRKGENLLGPLEPCGKSRLLQKKHCRATRKVVSKVFVEAGDLPAGLVH